MPLMLKLLLAVQVISALAIIVLVLLQQGKGADMGSAFGSGSSGSLFGATGAANFLSRATKWARWSSSRPRPAWPMSATRAPAARPSSPA